MFANSCDTSQRMFLTGMADAIDRMGTGSWMMQCIAIASRHRGNSLGDVDRGRISMFLRMLADQLMVGN